MVHWGWLVAAAAAAFIFGGIVGGAVACIPFFKALQRARESEASHLDTAACIQHREKKKE